MYKVKKAFIKGETTFQKSNLCIKIILIEYEIFSIFYRQAQHQNYEKNIYENKTRNYIFVKKKYKKAKKKYENLYEIS